jgi:hypothetical protein
MAVPAEQSSRCSTASYLENQRPSQIPPKPPQLSHKFLKRIGVAHPDPIKIAGGAKSLASPEQESDREFILDQIRKSMQLHGTTRAILMAHSDCGAYGNLAMAFTAIPGRKPSITSRNCSARLPVYPKPSLASKFKPPSTSKVSGMPKSPRLLASPRARPSPDSRLHQYVALNPS